LRQKNKKKNLRSGRRKFAFAGRSKNVKRLRLVKQIERGRGRELVGLRKLDRIERILMSPRGGVNRRDDQFELFLPKHLS
jgi:hypothetical protein